MKNSLQFSTIYEYNNTMEQSNTTINQVQIEQKVSKLGCNTKICIYHVSTIQILLCCHVTCPNVTNQHATQKSHKDLPTMYRNNITIKTIYIPHKLKNF